MPISNAEDNRIGKNQTAVHGMTIVLSAMELNRGSSTQANKVPRIKEIKLKSTD